MALDFSGDKTKNIYDMYCVLKEYYKVLQDNYECAIIFKGSDITGTRIYDVKSAEKIKSPTEGHYKLDIGNDVSEFEKLHNLKNDSMCMTVIHNHRQGSTFGYQDIGCMLKNEIYEIFLDSDVYIYCAVKGLEIQVLSRDKRMRDEYMKIFNEICDDVAGRYKSRYDEIYNGFFSDDIMRVKAVEVADSINADIWERVKKQGMSLVQFGKIKKSELERRAGNRSGGSWSD